MCGVFALGLWATGVTGNTPAVWGVCSRAMGYQFYWEHP